MTATIARPQVGDRVRLDYDPSYVDGDPRILGRVVDVFPDGDFDFAPDEDISDCWTVCAHEQANGRVRVVEFTRCAGSEVGLHDVSDARFDWKPMASVVCPGCGRSVGSWVDVRTVRVDVHDREVTP